MISRVLFAMVLGSVIAGGSAQLLTFNERVHQELLDESKGQVVLFDFWATWCSPCRNEMPLLVGLYRKLGPDGFRLITVSADEPSESDAALAFLRRHNVPEPAYLKSVRDGDRFIDAIDRKWAGTLPALFLYDRQGKLVQSFIGKTRIEILEQAIRGML